LKNKILNNNIYNNNKLKFIWIYNPNKTWSFWFVDVEWEKKWYFVHEKNKNFALPWDKVEFTLTNFNWKIEAKITNIIERTKPNIVWELILNTKNISQNKKELDSKKIYNPSYGFVIPKSSLYKNDIFIPWSKLKNAKNWDIVLIKILNFIWKNPEWEIIEIIWKKTDKFIDIKSYILDYGFKIWFNDKITDELKNISDKIDLQEIIKRIDLRNLFTFTIDWEDARDLDDAISIEKKDSGDFILYIHIADVTHYVKESSEIDKEAYIRWTSVYLVDRVLAMLEHKLSNNLCSLHNDSDKLTLTCEINLFKDWLIKDSKVYESIINSNYRLTYKEVDKIINYKLEDDINNIGNLFCNKPISQELIDKIKQSYILSKNISKHNILRWIINFDFPELKIILDKDNNPIWIKEYPRFISNKIIEEFMILANHCISKEFSSLPFLFRIHTKPSYDDVLKLQNILNLFNIDFKIKHISTKEFSNLLELISSNKNKLILEKLILRTLSKAIYSNKRELHFWLGLDYYTHFTSPIRRYPDLQIHRIIKDKIHNRLNKDKISYYNNILQEVAKNSSIQERKAEKLEYKIRDYFISKYYYNKIWEKFESKIVSVLETWLYIQFENMVEAFISIIWKNSFYFDEDIFAIKDKKTNYIYTIWDKLLVKLIEVDNINFKLICDFIK